MRPFVPILCFLLLLAPALSGCAHAPSRETESQRRAESLRQQLLKLHPSVAPEDAARFAQTAVEQSAALARQYHVVSPPWLHNVMVNGGLRARGLCYEWANDLFPVLHELNCETLEIQLAVARMDTRFEHNCIVVTARNQPFSKGVVLDAWRRSGRLWFGPVATDKKYPWKPLPRDRVAPELQKYLPIKTVPQ
jgi:hypothetical protein